MAINFSKYSKKKNILKKNGQREATAKDFLLFFISVLFPFFYIFFGKTMQIYKLFFWHNIVSAYLFERESIVSAKKYIKNIFFVTF